MKFFNFKSIQSKIIVYTLLCTAIVGVLSNLYLYAYMNGIISEKADNIDNMYLDTIQQQINRTFADTRFVLIAAASNVDVNSAILQGIDATPAEQRRRMQAGNILTDYLRGSAFDKYVYKLMAFNLDGVVIQASASRNGSHSDFEKLLTSQIYKNRKTNGEIFTYEKSISPNGSMCFAMIIPMLDAQLFGKQAYAYMELSPAIVTDVLMDYSQINTIFSAAKHNKIMAENTNDMHLIEALDIENISEGQRLKLDGTHYRIDTRSIIGAELKIFNCVDTSILSIDTRRMIYTLIVVMASVFVVALGILIISSNFITRPLKKLIAHINRMAENDFSADPEIEAQGDEIGEVGKVINEMCLSFKHLLSETVEVGEQKKNIEIALLQSQVNPHFLYNTLDSIHWMAVIQKNPGICNITRSLSNLLKNMAKGYSQKISIEEELKLLEDYVTIQSIRYLETFELVNNIEKSFYSYNIVKLTLQPIVENAIFHGIEPSGAFGTITLTAREDGKFVIISVEDTGVGMSFEDISRVMTATRENKNNHSMNGIGVANVNNRLALVYGAQCGLTIESEVGKFTRVSIKILKEEPCNDV